MNTSTTSSILGAATAAPRLVAPIVEPIVAAFGAAPLPVRLLLALIAFLGFARLSLELLMPRPRQTPEALNLPGPPERWYARVLGHLPELKDHRYTLMPAEWIATSPTGRCRHLWGRDTIWTFDPVTMGHVFANTDTWHRPHNAIAILEHISGSGLLSIEGPKHRRQRRIMNPAFSGPAVRDMFPVMQDKADELVALVGRLVDEDSLQHIAAHIPPKPEDIVPGARKIDVLALSSRLTQDVIGLAAFNYDLGSLSVGIPPETRHEPDEAKDDASLEVGNSNQLDGQKELCSSLERMLNSIFGNASITVLQNDTAIRLFGRTFLPFNNLPTENRRHADEARGVMVRVSRAKKRAMEILDSVTDADTADKADKSLLDRLVRANLSAKPEAHLSDPEVMSQMATLLFAGSTTTAGTISSALYQLALNPSLQQRLRAEIESVGEGHPSFDTLNGLPLLDAVVRETLRLEPPASCTVRVALKDTVLPISIPVRGRDGKMIEKAIPVLKDSYVFLSISSQQHNPDIWGPDTDKFNPDRFQDPTVPRTTVPGSVWGGGWRIAVTEIKAVLFALLTRFQFEPLPSKPEIDIIMNVASRPEVRGEPGGQLPLLVRHIES